MFQIVSIETWIRAAKFSKKIIIRYEDVKKYKISTKWNTTPSPFSTGWVDLNFRNGGRGIWEDLNF